MFLLAASLLWTGSLATAVLRGPRKTMTTTFHIRKQQQLQWQRHQEEQQGSLSKLGLGNMDTTDWAWLVIGFVCAVLGVAILVFIVYCCKQRWDSRGDDNKSSPSSTTPSSSRRRRCCCRGLGKGNSDDNEDDENTGDDNKEQPRNDPTRSESESSQVDRVVPGRVVIGGVPGRGAIGGGHVNNINNTGDDDDVVDNQSDVDDTWSFSMASYSVAIGTGRENDEDNDDDDDDYAGTRSTRNHRYRVHNDEETTASWDRAAQNHYEIYEDRRGRTLYNI